MTTYDLTLYTHNAEFGAVAGFSATGTKGGGSAPAKFGIAEFAATVAFEAVASIVKSGAAEFGAVVDFSTIAGQQFDLSLYVAPAGTEQTWDATLITDTRSGAAAFGAVADFAAVSASTSYNWFTVTADIDEGDVIFRATAAFAATGRKNARNVPAFALKGAFTAVGYDTQQTGVWVERTKPYTTWTERDDSSTIWSER